MTGQAIRIMTWNVHGTFNLNPRFDVEPIVKLIGKWSPHVVALQEVDSRGRAQDPFRRLEQAIGGHSVHAHSIVTEDGNYGQTLISCLPWLSEPQILDLSFRRREPRRAIGVELRTPFGGLHVVATHLGLSFRERQQQSRSLLAFARRSIYPTIVMGDFNDWFWVGSVRGALAANFPVRTRRRTFPGIWPLLKLDRIYAGNSIGLVSDFVDRAASGLSDHLPVIADFTLRGMEAAGPELPMETCVPPAMEQTEA
jgi:endonuclease/exonuclease/phosphatase family metal-dependent hydrolase